MELVFSTIGVDLTMVEGVNGSTMDTKAIPDGARVRGSKLGCFRGHANAWRHIVKSGIETALILEDDIDFDPEIKDILKRFSTQLLTNNSIPLGYEEPLSLGQTLEDAHRTAKSSPYGVGWDSLFLGQCQNEPNPQRTDLQWTYSDPHTPKKEQLESCFVKEMEQDFHVPADKGLRIVSPTFGPICLQGYALSRRGAQRLLYHLSYIGLKRETDNSVADMHRKGVMNGYTLTPPIFSRWRVGGAKDSDNMPQNEKQKANPDGRGNVGGSSKNLKGSARLKMTLPWQDGGLLMNAWDEMERLLPRGGREQKNEVKSN
jgi:GR25 family glycosyltransferase involved in LPS biosynthesis